jgi:hypothetical protein
MRNLTVLLLLAPFAWSGEKYAGPNGSDSLPCGASSRTNPLSLAHAVDDCLNSGDNLILLDGEYYLTSNPGIVIDNDRSGTPDAHTIIKSDTKWGAKLIYTGPECFFDPGDPENSEYPVIVRLGWENAAFIDIIDLDISSADDRGGAGIGLYGHDSIVQGNRIHGMNCRQSCRDGFNFGVLAGGLYNTVGNHQIIGNYIYNISPYDAGPCEEDDAIFYQQRHGLIANNVIVHNGGNAIQLRCNTGGTADNPFYIVNNTITNMKAGGISYSGNSGRAGCNEGGCAADADHPIQDADYIYVINNIISCGADVLYSYGIYENDVTGSGACMIGDHNVVKNNLTFMPERATLACPGTRWWVNVGLTLATIWSSDGTPNPRLPNTDPEDIETLYDNPLYRNDTGDNRGDYHLQPGSPAIDSGLFDPGVPLSDFDMLSRPQRLMPSRGAFEFFSSAPRLP